MTFTVEQANSINTKEECFQQLNWEEIITNYK